MTSVLYIVAERWLQYVSTMLWQSSLVMLAVWALYLVCRKRSATLRYGLLCLVLVKLLLPTSLHSVTGIGHWAGWAVERVKKTSEPATYTSTAEPQKSRETAELDPAPLTMLRIPSDTIAKPQLLSAPAAEIQRPVHWPFVLFATWLTLAGLLGLALVIHTLRVRRRFAKLEKVTEASIVAMLENCRAALGIHRRVRLYVLPCLSSPLLVGMWRPRIVMSNENISQLSHEQLRPLILHELAHLKRHDLWVNAFQIALQVLWFFHPGLWITNWLIRREREKACDDIVLARTDRRAQAYADSMLAVLKASSTSSFSTLGLAGIAEHGSALRTRLQRILDTRRQITIRISLAGVAGLFAIGAVLLPMARGENLPAKIAREKGATTVNGADNLHGDAYVKGRCITETGTPLEGAEIILYYNPFPEGWGEIPKEMGCRIIARTRTDATGNFSFPTALLTYMPKPYQQKNSHPKPAGYYLLAKHSDRAVSAAVLQFGKETERRQIMLYPGFAQKMYAVSPGQTNRVPGVRIWLHLIRGSESKAPEWSSGFCLNEDIGWVSATTDESGECVVSNLPPVDCCFFTTKEGYAATWRGGIIAPNSGNICFDVSPGAFVNGKALLPNGSPATRLLVKFVVGGNTTWVPYAITDAEGNFHSPPIQTYEWDRGAWPDMEDLHNGIVTVMADRFLDGNKSVAGAAIPLQTKEKTRFDNLLLAVEEVDTVPLHVKMIAPDKTPLPKFRVWLGMLRSGIRFYEKVARFDTDNAGTAFVDLPKGEVMFSRESDVKLTGWYVPDEGVSSFTISWMQDRWTTNREYKDSSALFKIIAGKGTRDSPLIIQANVIPSTSLRGAVFDQASKPAVDCNAYVAYPRGGVQALTDTNGVFNLQSVPAGTNVRVFAITKDKKLAGLSDTYATGATNAAVSLKPTASYPGRCHDSEGGSVGRIFIRVDLKIEDRLLSRVREEITTDAEGNFVLHNACPDATYHIWWSPDQKVNKDFDFGYADIAISNIPAGEPFTVEVKRYKETIRGVVVDIDGNPIHGATVQIEDWTMLSQDARMHGINFSTDGSGRFEIGRLAKGKVGLAIRHKDYKGIKLNVATDSVNVRAVLPPKGNLKVSTRVMDPEGKPVAGAKIILSKMQFDPAASDISESNKKAAFTDLTGTCIFDKIEVDQARDTGWVLLCDVPGHYYEIRSAARDMDSEFEITLRGITNSLNGTVQDRNGSPVSGAKVTVRGIRRMAYALPDSLITTATDENGRFVFPRVSEDSSIVLEISSDSFATKRFQSWNPPNTENRSNEIAVTLLPACEIAGKIVYEGNDKPAEDISVIAQGVGNPWNATQTKSDKNGEYHIRALDPGLYTIWARVEGDSPDWTCEPIENIEAKTGQTFRNRDFVLIKGITVSGTITDAKSKQPLKDVYVRAQVANNSRSRINAAAKTKADGRYVLRVPSGGTYEITLPQFHGRIRDGDSKTVIIEIGKSGDKVDFVIDQ